MTAFQANVQSLVSDVELTFHDQLGLYPEARAKLARVYSTNAGAGIFFPTLAAANSVAAPSSRTRMRSGGAALSSASTVALMQNPEEAKMFAILRTPSTRHLASPRAHGAGPPSAMDVPSFIVNPSRRDLYSSSPSITA